MYKLDKRGIAMLKNIKKFDVKERETLIVFPGRGKMRTGENAAYGIGGCVKTSNAGEQLSSPLVFVMDPSHPYDEQDVQIVVSSSEYERAIEFALITSPDEILLDLDIARKKLVVKGAGQMEVPYIDAASAHLPAAIDIGEIKDANCVIQFKTEAFVRRMKCFRILSDEYMELRAIEDLLMVIPAAPSWMFAVSQFDPSEYQVQKKSEKLNVMINVKYLGYFESPFMGENCTLAVFERGFVWNSNGSTLIGALPEMGGHVLYSDQAVLGVLKNCNTICDGRFELADAKKVQRLIGCWEEDLKARSKNVSDVAVKMMLVQNLEIQASPMLQYAAPISLITPIKDGMKEYYFAGSQLSRVLGTFTHGQFCFAGDGDKSLLFAENILISEDGTKEKTGDVILLLGVYKSTYSTMCANLTI